LTTHAAVPYGLLAQAGVEHHVDPEPIPDRLCCPPGAKQIGRDHLDGSIGRKPAGQRLRAACARPLSVGRIEPSADQPIDVVRRLRMRDDVHVLHPNASSIWPLNRPTRWSEGISEFQTIGPR
jgi:hypothetical protein